MPRIRTVKPEFFRHEALQDIEIANPGAYPMMVFAGLWVVADREGRFEWRPRRIKLDVLPFLEFDMEETLSLLEEIGLVIRYVHEGNVYGAIVSWERHQVVGRDEPPSEIPAPDGSKTPYFRPLNQTQRFKVYERDNWTCAYCSRNMRNDKRAACLDHVVPYSKGGTNRAENLVTCCKKCNAAKSDMTPTQAGFNWPNGLGEYLDKDTNTVRQYGVNTTLTGCPIAPDKEKEKEREWDKEKEGKGNTSPLRAEVLEIFDFWISSTGHVRAKLDPNRIKQISGALKLGYTVEDIKSAITGCTLSAYHMGENESGCRYDSLALILRDAGKIDQFIGYFNSPPVKRSDAAPAKTQHQLNQEATTRAIFGNPSEFAFTEKLISGEVIS